MEAGRTSWVSSKMMMMMMMNTEFQRWRRRKMGPPQVEEAWPGMDASASIPKPVEDEIRLGPPKVEEEAWPGMDASASIPEPVLELPSRMSERAGSVVGMAIVSARQFR